MRRWFSVALVVLGLVAALAMPFGSTAVAKSTKTATCRTSPNRAGETKKLIRIGNSADISGPIPGLYTGAQLATKAYAAYFNASGKRICGRKIAVDAFDSATSAGADQKSYAQICAKDFAAVGSMSDDDLGGASVTQHCHLPDLRARSTSAARNACSTCFGVEATTTNEWLNSVPDYFVQHDGAAAQKAAMLYINDPATKAAALTEMKAAQKRGFTYLYSSAIDFAEFNYVPYVEQMKSKNVEIVQFIGSFQQQVRLAEAMQQVGFHPAVYLLDSAAYTPSFAAEGGTSVDGVIVYTDFLPLSTDQTELNLYKKWLARTSPGAKPTPDGLYAWSAMKLFTTEAVSLGKNLTRASLVKRVRTVKAWTGGGLHTPMAVGPKQLSGCARFLQVSNGSWVSYAGTAYRCSGVTKVS
ncbi:MAG TPA: ABC transporter substrate-binding protein [Marmoricola sp.]|jgi:ABC-type branched-subunit amino acid transport system substrate-binding protein|nr:ABC transporter substrate-binding protein [Marmoricola sp.]